MLCVSALLPTSPGSSEPPKSRKCAICGSRFADKRCYFCQSHVCTSCVVPSDVMGSDSTTKCLTCHRKNVTRVGLSSLLMRNKVIIAVIGGFWIFTVFPLPFLKLAGIDLDPESIQPVLIATAVMTIPFVFMLAAWQKRAPRGS